MDPVIEKLSEVSEKQAEILANQLNQQKILEKHSDLLEKQGETLLRNTLTVEEHHRRSTLLEKEVKRLDNDVRKIQDKVENVKGIGKLVMWLGYLAMAMPLLYGLFIALKKLGL